MSFLELVELARKGAVETDSGLMTLPESLFMRNVSGPAAASDLAGGLLWTFSRHAMCEAGVWGAVCFLALHPTIV